MQAKRSKRLSLIKVHDNPVYDLEVARPERNKSLRAIRRILLPLTLSLSSLAIFVVVVGVALSDPYDIEGWLFSTLGITLGILFAIQLLVGASVSILTVIMSAPKISGEIELQSWQLLRATSLPLRKIILGKFASIFKEMRIPLIALLVLRLITTVTAMIIYVGFLLREGFYYSSPSDWADFQEMNGWIPVAVIPIVFLIYYVSQPFVQLLTNTALGLLASAFMRTRARAIASALALRLVTWIFSVSFSILSVWGVGFLFANWVSPQYAPLEIYSNFPEPSTDQIVLFGSAIAILFLVSIILSQVGLITLSIGLTMRRARRLG